GGAPLQRRDLLCNQRKTRDPSGGYSAEESRAPSYSAACFSRVGTVSPASSAARAASYSALSRATTSPAGGASWIWPTPWPAPQMSRQALVFMLPPEPKFILLLSASGRAS